VADVARLPRVFEQIALIAGLRWRILKNGLQRKHNVWDLIGMIWVAFFSGSLVLGVGIGLFAGGYAMVSHNRVSWFALVYWGIFLWWQVFPMFLAGFGSNFDFTNLLRFPLSLRAFYLLGLAYGFSDFAAISSMCWIVALIAGAGVAQANLVPALLGVSALFVLLNVTMERLIGSWLEKILAKRRSREIFVGVFIICMVSLNFLNPAVQRWGHTSRPTIMHSIPYLWWLPGSLAGNAISASSVLDIRGVLANVMGLCGWAVLLSALLWRRFAAQYAGEVMSEESRPAALRKTEKKAALAEEDLGFLAPQVAAVVIKEFRYLTRNGMAFVSLIIPPLMVIFFTMQFGPGSPLKQHSIKPAMFFPGIMAYLLLILVSPAYNSFAYEGKGMQSYFMAPVRFRDVLLGKNLFLGALIALELGLAFAVLVFRVGWPGTPMFVATLTGGTFAIVGQLAIANWSSLVSRRRWRSAN